MKPACTSRAFRVEQPSVALANELWSLPHPGGFFAIADGGDEQQFVQAIMKRTLYVLRFRFGYVRVQQMNDGAFPMIVRVHGVFHDPKALSNRMSVRDLQDGLMFLVEVHRELQRIECVVPAPSRSLQRLLVYVGFRNEGRMRSWYRFSDGSIIDAQMFGFVK